jgi:hypothetical protein
MLVDKPPVNLTLIIYSAGNSWTTVYITSDNLQQVTFFFSINPFSPLGEYRAEIMYARTTLAEIFFNVLEK